MEVNLMQPITSSPENGWKLTSSNFDHAILRFRERQAGIGVIYDPDDDKFTYNAYCLETKLLEELYSCEFEFLDDALDVINQEFGSWELVDLSAKEGCGTCVAK
jgi:hypothetical protein